MFFLLDVVVDMEGLQSDASPPTEEGWNQLKPVRSESLTMETSAKVYFSILKAATMKTIAERK
ncbi:hypothetical protein [Alkalicoccus saliphilus]|uniref:Uncharacterized protein n=1 Tax=Alkalicoccus saliphilus TaxID=200989 RepID=A0A2T4UA39_9BACI|nr:hypothetical protein [Alkalicoccus saliphilus]PTL40263.1 hypothetical protein C6Y45_02470 [Alkalicoccus saliphilus]